MSDEKCGCPEITGFDYSVCLFPQAVALLKEVMQVPAHMAPAEYYSSKYRIEDFLRKLGER